ASMADRSDKVTVRMLSMVICVLSAGCSALLLLFSGQKLMLSFLYMVLVVLLQTMMPLINALGMECINLGISVDFGFARGIGSLTFSILSLVIGNVLKGRNPDIIPMIIIGLYMFLFLGLINFKFVSQKTEVPKDNIVAQKGFSEYLQKYRSFYISLVGVVLIFSSHIVLNNFLFQITTDIGGTSSQMGTAMAICAFIELPTMMFFFMIVGKIKCEGLIKISAIFFTLKTFLTYFCSTISGLYLIQLTQLLGFALFTPASVYYVNKIMDEDDKAKGQAFLTMAITAGGVVGNVFGGVAIDIFGVKPLLLISAIGAAIGTAIIVVFIREQE
ncbi:MAG: MFS transporter, partial [Oscillospiraceae bacterium]